MVNLIVYSKDRPIQLHLFLESTKRNSGNLFTSVNVIYKVSNTDYNRGYELLKKRNVLSNINWVLETNFKEDTLKLLNSPFTCFMVDDMIFYKKLDSTIIPDILEDLKLEKIFTFMLGVGKNCKYSQTANLYFENPEFTTSQNGKVLTWDWKKVNNNSEFSCPFMLVGNIFLTSAIRTIVQYVNFTTPSYFEHALQEFTKQKKDTGCMIKYASCPEHNVVLHSTNNRVQDDIRNLAGIEFPEDPVLLNKSYLGNYIIDYDKLNFSNINGLHKEIKFEFCVYK